MYSALPREHRSDALYIYMAWSTNAVFAVGARNWNCTTALRIINAYPPFRDISAGSRLYHLGSSEFAKLFTHSPGSR